MRVEKAREETTFVDVCMDFDGVIHEYGSGWIAADVIPDAPVLGTLLRIRDYLDAGLSVAIHSARSAQPGGIEAIQAWLHRHDARQPSLVSLIKFPVDKPAATLYIDDRGFPFMGPGSLPTVEYIRSFKPWNKKEQS